MAGLTRFCALSVREQGRFIEAALALCAVHVVLTILPFRWALRLLRVAPGDAIVGRVAGCEAAEIARAVSWAARHVPFRAVCLQQAFAALLMLRRRGLAATVHFGLARETAVGRLTAHAWSHSGPVSVTGVEAAKDFVEIAVFVAKVA